MIMMVMKMNIAAPGVSDDEGAKDGADSSSGPGDTDGGSACTIIIIINIVVTMMSR